jgi:hypothetical protein
VAISLLLPVVRPAPGFVGQGHQQRAADAGLDVLLGRVLRQPRELLRQRGLESFEFRKDRDLVVAHAQPRRMSRASIQLMSAV